MKSPTHRAASLGGGPRFVGRSLGIAAKEMTMATSVHHNDRDSLEVLQREAELGALLRSAAQHTARQLLLTVPPSQRSTAESNKLQDIVRGHTVALDKTVPFLMALQARVDRNYMGEAMDAIHVRLAPAPEGECLIDLTLDEEKAEAAMDEAQMLALHEPVPVRFAQLRETALQHVRAAMRVADAAARLMHVKPARTA